MSSEELLEGSGGKKILGARKAVGDDGRLQGNDGCPLGDGRRYLGMDLDISFLHLTRLAESKTLS